MRAFLPLVIISTALSAELPMEVGEFSTKAGKKYSGVTITEKRDDGISIRHEGGTARIPFEQIPDDTAKMLGGFDPKKAAESRKEADAREKSALESIEGEMRRQAESEKAAKAAADDYAAARFAVLDVVQVNGKSALCRVAWFEEAVHFRTVTDAFGRQKKVPVSKVELSDFLKPLFWVNNVSGVADDDQIVVKLKETKELKTYRTTGGGNSTVRILQVVDQPAEKPEK